MCLQPPAEVNRENLGNKAVLVTVEIQKTSLPLGLCKPGLKGETKETTIELVIL